MAYQEFIVWFNSLLAAEEKLSTLKISNKGNYGWSEFIEYQPCQNHQELKQFYYRIGLLLMLVYLFRGSDVHAENIVAHGAYPVLLDYECLFSPVIYLGPKIPKLKQSRFYVSAMFFFPIELWSTLNIKELI